MPRDIRISGLCQFDSAWKKCTYYPPRPPRIHGGHTARFERHETPRRSGLRLRDSREYDKAIIDSSEAGTGLDPNCTLALAIRAALWCEKRAYDKAIADCSEAIRLDPKEEQPSPAAAMRGVSSGSTTRQSPTLARP